MICAEYEWPNPDVWPSVLHSLDQADELMLVGGQFGVLGRHGATEKGDRAIALMQDHPESRA